MIRVSVSGVMDLPPLHGIKAVISIQDPGDGRPWELQHLRLPVLDLAFHDVEDKRDALDQQPERWHLGLVERFLARLPLTPGGFPLHIHCYAGMSRSTAVASFVLATLEPALTDDQIVGRVLAVRPQAIPNRLILSYADELLGRKLHRAWG